MNRCLKICKKFLGKHPCSETDGLPQKNPTVSMSSSQAQNLPLEMVSCNQCVEESKVCPDSILKIANEPTNAVQLEKANSSFLHSVINMSGMLIGLGQLSMPYALETGGWASSFLLVGLGTACAFSAYLMGKCLDKDPKSRSYADIGKQAFGRTGKRVAFIFIYMNIFMGLVSYTISLHDNINTVFSGATLKVPLLELSTSQILTLIAVLVALPSLWLRNMSSISLLSSGGICMSLLIFLAVASTAIFREVEANQSIPFLQLHKIPHVSGIYMFSYAGHLVFPNIHRAMKEPSKFKKVILVSFTLVTGLYTTLAFMGAKLFGPTVNSQITLSMPPHLVVTKIALWATVLTPMTKYALEIIPVAIEIEHKLAPTMKPRTRTIITGCMASILLLMVLALALTVPYFQYVLSLTGSLVSTAVVIILPCTFYLKIYKGEVSAPLFVLNIVLMMIGILLGIVGTISSSRSLIKTFKAARHSN